MLSSKCRSKVIPASDAQSKYTGRGLKSNLLFMIFLSLSQKHTAGGGDSYMKRSITTMKAFVRGVIIFSPRGRRTPPRRVSVAAPPKTPRGPDLLFFLLCARGY